MPVSFSDLQLAFEFVSSGGSSQRLAQGERENSEKFAASLLEEVGFEPSVPLDTTKISRGAHVAPARSRANGNFGANENRHPDAAWRRPRDRRLTPMVTAPITFSDVRRLTVALR